MTFKVSVVMAAYNSENYLSIAIDSLINQSLDFKRNIQIIIVDDSSSDNTLNVALKYRNEYPENIIVLHNEENKGASFSRNLGLKYVEGEYVNFLDSDDFITKHTFNRVEAMFKKHSEIDIVSIPIYFFGSKNGEHILNDKFEKTRVVDLLKEPENIQLSGPSSFFRYSKIKNYEFNENLKVSEDSLLINQMLLKNPKIGFLSDCGYYYRKYENSSSLIGSSTSSKSYFTSRVDDYFLKLIDESINKFGEVPTFIQYLIFYDLFWMARVREVGNLLDSQEIRELYANIIKILSYIDKEVILNFQIDLNLINVHLLLLKCYGWDYLNDKSNIFNDEIISGGELEKIVADFDLNNVFIDNIMFVNDDEMYISGIYTTFDCNETEIFIVLNDDEVISTKKINYSQRNYYSLNFHYAYTYCFECKVPVKNKISFKTSKQYLPINFNWTSRLSRNSKYMLSDKYIAYDRFDHIEIVDRKGYLLFKTELNVLKDMIINRHQGWRTGVLLRILYFLAYPFLKYKRIWLFMDLPDRAEDNGIKLFEYAVENPPHDIEKYFTIVKSQKNYDEVSKFGKILILLGLDSPDSEYSKVKKIGPVLAYKSLKHRLYTLFAEFIISSNPDNFIIYPFWDNFDFVSGLLKSKTVFLQHGVTLHNISKWLNNANKNLSMLVAISDMEKEAFLAPDYGYSEDIIKVLGFPRFDNLEKAEDMKEIILMPTWRRNLNVIDEKEFRKSHFFEIYNKILNDTQLLEFLDSHGYCLVFKPHPNLLKFIDVFDKHPLVDFENRTYNDLFNHSSLLITDYSSVAFDFAYLGKPIIYYHFDGDTFHFDKDEAYFKYDSMGFGPIANTHEELMKNIMEYVLNDCEMDDMYKERVEKFFKFRDKLNSKRVYDAILELDSSG